ncbi:Endolytic peptidoglycan transglycosylase RlpA [Candidatus Entotheonellaceae bacterium PAL068K]
MQKTWFYWMGSISCSVLFVSLLPALCESRPWSSVPRIQHGIASWYGEKFHGHRTANGEIYNMFQLTAAHNTAPFGMHAIVTNLDSGVSVRVRINDRGPFVDNRILDLSYEAARRLSMLETGLARVKLRFLPETIPIRKFIVQVGAYRVPDNAAHVYRELASQYARVWITAVLDGSQTLYRVRLGSFIDRHIAERVARQVQALGYAAKVLPLTQPPRVSSLRPPANPLWCRHSDTRRQTADGSAPSGNLDARCQSDAHRDAPPAQSRRQYRS